MNFITVTIAVIVLTSVLLPAAVAKTSKNHIDAYDKGVSWKPVVPMKKVTFINYNEESYLDDYAYLAAIPTSVFYDGGGEHIFSAPLLFYHDEIDISDNRYRTLNDKIGIDYFMEDWMSFCGGRLDSLRTVNVPKSKLDGSWRAKEYDLIEGNDPYALASEIALHDWSYSDDAVVAVIDEKFETPDTVTSNKIEGALPACEIHEYSEFQVEQTNSLNPVYSDEFTVGEEYKYIKAEAWWDAISFAGMLFPAGDPDIQLYCKQEDGWMQAAAASHWNLVFSKGREYTQSYVYKPGAWRVGITDFPTKGEVPTQSGPLGIVKYQGSILKALNPKVTYHVDIAMYPGIELTIPDTPPFGCRDVDFTLTWDNPNINLGFSIIGPAGEAVFTMINESRTESQEIHFESLGECLPGEHYAVSVFALDDVSTPLDFQLDYTWRQGIAEAEADSLTSATEGAVLASVLNAPLLYTSSSGLSDATKNTLYKLGVKNIYLVNLGDHLSRSGREEISNVARIKAVYTEPGQTYDAIRGITDRNDVIFTTIDPWTYWYLGELEPADETEAGLFIGPAAYIAAHHGAPVIIIDNHPRLSSAVVYHNEFWRRFADDRVFHIPSVAEMSLTGKRIYDFLKDYNFDKEGLESIITVADQYDIGVSWDRIFPGVANPGRFCGSPVDTSCWISRTVFYPAMIFVNPALQGEVALINGSVSERKGIGGMITKPWFNTLSIRESGEEKFNYPVLCSFVTHKHRFNERASKYYGSKYQCADGLTPGEDNTMEPIDQGSIKEYTGKEGAFFPDMTESEIVPFYLSKGGYDTAFSTSLPAVVNNLNKGVILWIHGSHGMDPDGGATLFWDPMAGFEQQAKNNKKIVAKIAKQFAGAIKDKNPWRGYEWLLGSTEEPDTMSMDVQGIFPFTNMRIPLPAMGLAWVVARKPVRELIPPVIRDILNAVFPFRDPFAVDDLYDGVVGSIGYATYQYKKFNAAEIEENLENLHSAGFITGICQTSNTYFHLMLIRHGSVFQVQDPWPTSWYGTVWRQSIPRDLALGYTVGEAYTRGISHVGILYITDPPQWWWDNAENVVYFGDPDLRVYVPGTEYSDANNWNRPDTLRYNADVSIEGHMPFGAVGYPHEKTPTTFWQQYLWVIVALAAIIILVIVAMSLGRKQKR